MSKPIKKRVLSTSTQTIKRNITVHAYFTSISDLFEVNKSNYFIHVQKGTRRANQTNNRFL